MAADSIVTVSDESTYEGVNKLFMLSNNPPMGIMIYGNAEFMGIPMETLIDEYKKIADFGVNNSVHKIMEDFLDFLENSYHKYADSSINDYYFDFNAFKEKIIQIIENDKSALVNDLLFIDSQVSDEILNLAKEKALFDEHEEIFEELVNNISDLSIENPGDALKKKFISELSFTGIVIAGFDEEYIYPSFCEYEVYFVFNEKIFHQKHDEGINIQEPMIKPFAQRDVIDNFLFGIDFYLIKLFEIFFRKSLDNYGNYFLNSDRENYEDGENQILDSTVDDIKFSMDYSEYIMAEFENLIKSIIDIYSYPILANLTALPKNELINMCELLIRITSLKRKVSRGLTTVGGDIDVALISNGDGFIWVKRKQYFDIESNPHYLVEKIKNSNMNNIKFELGDKMIEHFRKNRISGGVNIPKEHLPQIAEDLADKGFENLKKSLDRAKNGS